jgi:F-type H+-transporting ATPase subunit alpha
VIWAGTTGELDDIPVGDVRRFEQELLAWLKRHRSDTYTAIESSNDLNDEQIESLQSGVNEFKELFRRGDTGIKLNEPDAEAMEEGRESHETVTREVRRPAGKDAS